MKMIKTLVVLSSLVISISLGMLMGCKKDTPNNNNVTIKYCDTAHCHGAGVCDSATRSCICPTTTGYEGTDCATEQRAKFYGTYTGSTTCTSGGPFTDVWTISAGSAGIFSVTMIYAATGSGGSSPISGTISGNSVSFPAQTIVFGGTTETFSGTAALNGNQLTLTTVETSGATTYSCTFIGTK